MNRIEQVKNCLLYPANLALHKNKTIQQKIISSKNSLIMKKHKVLTFLSILLISLTSSAQEIKKAVFSADAWSVEAKKYEFTSFQGKQCLYLENGNARLKESSLKTGIIEFDVNFSESRKFVGVHFRGQDAANYEEFYLRAHLSGNPDAMQYTPVFNGVAGWQLYHGKGYSNAMAHKFDEWVHVRLVIAEDQMEVFVGDMSKPVLYAHDLKMDAKAGEIGFGTFLGGAYYTNLTYQPLEKVQFVSEIKPIPTTEKGTIQEWQVSQAFDVKSLTGVHDLSSFSSYQNAQWTKLNSEYSGTVNLAQVAIASKKTNTVFVKVNIQSDKAQVKRLDFGYSDMATVFVNKKSIYSGQRNYRSRDYRYLGTIGYFDAIHLHLQKGNNEIVFAITENFGGWGLRAKLENLQDILLSSK